jgi:cytoskeletal protein CcmA (bactofilin family)
MKKYKPSPTKKHTQSSDRHLGESSVDSFSPNLIEVTDESSHEELIIEPVQHMVEEKPFEENLTSDDEQNKAPKAKSKLWSLFGSKAPKEVAPLYEISEADLKAEEEAAMSLVVETPVEVVQEAEPLEEVIPEVVLKEVEPLIEEVKPEPKQKPKAKPVPIEEPVIEEVEVKVEKIEERLGHTEVEEKKEDLTVEEHEEKAKSRLWGAFKSKEPEPRNLPLTERNKDTSEEKRVTMRTNEYPDLNSVSSKEPNAVISKMMAITGNVKLDTSLLLAGKVVGNIECEDHIEVRSNGVVEGNITAHSIKLSGGNIKGNITCEGTLETDLETVIVGDISAAVILVSGKVTGEVRAKESVSLTSTAVVKGDLYSASISVEKGAFLEGKYSVSKSLD